MSDDRRLRPHTSVLYPLSLSSVLSFYDHQRLAKLHRLRVLEQDLDNRAGLRRGNLVEGLHRLDDQERIACLDRGAHVAEWLGARLGRPIGRADHWRCHDTWMLGRIERTSRYGGRNRARGFRSGRCVGHGGLTRNPDSQSALLDFDLGQAGFVEEAREGAHHILVHDRIGFLLVVGRHQLNSVLLWTIAAGLPVAVDAEAARVIRRSCFYANSDGPQISLLCKFSFSPSACGGGVQGGGKPTPSRELKWLTPRLALARLRGRVRVGVNLLRTSNTRPCRNAPC